ncbi:hypothetical protein FACS189421_04210 [Bacteroidia bacterium]|nr:hypothetical protein FACS189421_04210 [Bacteroidia bacterium]GHT48082.1 hypothetical protein FACS189440_10750 [Bacteroidia bacterium]
MNHPLVSVIVLAYNVGRFIEECLQSIISQTYADIDIIVVVNGKSKDNTEEIVNRFAQQDNRIRLVYNHENSHISEGRRLGLNAINGNYFLFVDGDDCLPSESVDTLVQLMEANAVDIVMGSTTTFVHDLPSDTVHPAPCKTEIFSMEAYLLNSIIRMDIALPAKLYKSTLYTEKPIEFLLAISLYEDKLLHYQLVSYAGRLLRSNDIVYFVRKNPLSITNNLKYETVAGSFRVNNWLESFFRERGYFENRDFLLAYKANEYTDLYYLLTTGGLKAFKDFPKEVPDLLYSDYFKQPKVLNYIKGWKLFYIVLVLFRMNKYIGDLFGHKFLNIIRKITKKYKRYKYNKVARDVF